MGRVVAVMEKLILVSHEIISKTLSHESVFPLAWRIRLMIARSWKVQKMVTGQL